MGVALVIVGGALVYLSFWLLLYISEEKVQRHFNSWLNDLLSKNKDEADSYRIFNGALVSVVLMLFGMILVVGGLVKLFA